MAGRIAGLTRRGFLLASGAALAGGAAAYVQPLLNTRQFGGLVSKLVLPPATDADPEPALARRYPWVWHGEARRSELQLVNALQPQALEAVAGGASLGERVFRAQGGAAVVPWAPMFRRNPAISNATELLRKLCGAKELLVKDEGSDAVLLYGNKVRKYEFVLPNLAASGVRTVHTHGAYGSNHCAHLALALRYGGHGGQPMGLVASLYPQALTSDVAHKLHLLLAIGARLEFLESDLQAALSILERRRLNDAGPVAAAGYIPPGGSSPLAVFGHLNALLEVDEYMRAGQVPMSAPPDYLYVALGSGATAMGLVLGCHLLGWPTRVVATPSQDKPALAKLVVNGEIEDPFAVPHARAELDAALTWARRLGLPVDARGRVTAADLMQRHFQVERDAWLPAYGVMSPDVKLLRDVAHEHSLTLDATFTAKAFGAIHNAGSEGKLAGARVLFWNTYQRYELAGLLPAGNGWMSGLPAQLAGNLQELAA
ncbi:MAG: pyridoxal-phosphate dependent enzyme [Rhodocyclaceae bacterium]|nr:pyridoxal-phosphate dependent enzyme [Rhodocyclaceae bacterium]MBX3668677.1 pyridoxal-phosphate dependent enzyme [Rhodocyclaceae bacterium]